MQCPHCGEHFHAEVQTIQKSSKMCKLHIVLAVFIILGGAVTAIGIDQGLGGKIILGGAIYYFTARAFRWWFHG
jgi:hypothetical protein